MKVKDLKIGELYVVKNNYKSVHQVFTENIKLHPNVQDLKASRSLPKSLNYLYVNSERSRTKKQKPIMYLGTTKENVNSPSITVDFPLNNNAFCKSKFMTGETSCPSV